MSPKRGEPLHEDGFPFRAQLGQMDKFVPYAEHVDKMDRIELVIPSLED